MIKVGITGQSGFVGRNLYNEFGLLPNQIMRIPFEDLFFESDMKLRLFVKQCDVIVHLAAVNRHLDPSVIYDTNIRLVKQLIAAMEIEQVKPYLLFSSSTQEKCDNEYGKSKRDGRELLKDWAIRNDASFTGLVVPNVYGPFGQPNYNSFIATFCYKLTHGEHPEILQDSDVRLIYIGNLCKYIVNKIHLVYHSSVSIVERTEIPFDFSKKVTDVLSLLNSYKKLYFDHGIIPTLKDQNEVNLFNTFRSYIDYKNHFPVKLTSHTDPRGIFVETIKLGVGGQVSFSTTVPGITRGNHYHSRKIERFTVIKGKALIQLRCIGTEEVLEYYLDGNEPSYVDMPVWYTHSITNVGGGELYTQFWINEWYDPEDGDTYYEKI